MRPLSGRPWRAAAACAALALLPTAAAAVLAECDSLSLVQVDAHAAPAETGSPARLSVDAEAPQVESAFDEPKAAHRVVQLQDGGDRTKNKQGQLEFMASLLRDLNSAPLGDNRQPIDFSPLMNEPRITNGLLFGDLTKAIIDLAHEQKAPTANEVRTTDMLNGHSLLVNNLAVVLVLTCIAVVPLIGHKIDESQKAEGEQLAPRRFPYRIGLLLLASYLIWVPAMFSADFSFNIAFIVPVTGQRVGITRDEHNDHIPGPIHESTRTLVHLLWSTRAHTGAVLIAIYAFVVPATKLILLSVGEFFRFSEQVHLRRLSRNCILLMQFISKWAAPDMFAYVLVYYLIRKLQNLPISTLAMFDVGFTCYGVFSLTCAISSLGIPLPQVQGSELEEAKPPLVKRMLEGSSSTGSPAEKRRLFKLVVALASFWALLFLVGLMVPCFALHLDGQLLQDHVPDSMKQVLKMIKLNRIIQPQDVSLCEAMWAMLYWFVTDKDLNLLLAFVMISVFAVALTALNMANLLKTAWQLSQEAPAGRHPCPAMYKSEVLKHVSMLDVLIMGVIVGTCAAGIYRENGVIIYTCHGIWVLIAAEAMHYLTYFVVHSAAAYEIKVAEIQAKIVSYADGEKGAKKMVVN